MASNPYAASLGEHDPVTSMREAPALYASLTAARTQIELDLRSAPGQWSIREVLAHLADCEIVYGFRLRQTYSGETIQQLFDQDGWARSYAGCSGAEALEVFRTLREWNMTFISGLSAKEKELPTSHPELGEMTLWSIVEDMAGHDLHHLSKLKAFEAFAPENE
jgi:uncharacterized damage-inducible protein DinB